MSQLGAPLPHPPALVLAPPISNEEPVSINSITSSFVCDDDVLVDVASLYSPYDPTLAVSSEEITNAFLALSAGLSERDSDVHVPSELLATIWLYARAGSLSTWGSSRHGVLAHGDEQDRREPAPVKFPRAVLSVAAGNDHMLIQCLDGIYSVGRGAYGQLGMGDMRGDLRTPERIRDLDGLITLQVACGYWHSLFCTTTGVYVCGWNNHGQLGLGDNTRQQGTPALVDFKGQVPTAVAGGAFHSLFLVGGGVYSCGVGTSGELGLGDKVDHRTPVLLTAFKGKKVLSISAGGHRSFVQCMDGIYAFGDNYCGTLGVGDEEPRVIPVKIPAFDDLATRVTCISSRGGRTSVVVQGVGLFSFGNAENGKLGLGDSTNKSSPVLVPALADRDVQQTACGYDHSITVCERFVVACGLNKHGELGVAADAELEGEPELEDDAMIVMPGTGTGVLTPPPMAQAAPPAPVAPAPPAAQQLAAPAAAGAQIVGPGVVLLPGMAAPGGVPATPHLPPAGEPIKPDLYASTPLPVVGLQHCDVLSCAAGDGFSAAVFVPRAAPAGMVFATKPHYAVPFETRTK